MELKANCSICNRQTADLSIHSLQTTNSYQFCWQVKITQELCIWTQTFGNLHLLQLGCYGLTNKMSGIQQELGDNPQSEKLERIMFYYMTQISVPSCSTIFFPVWSGWQLPSERKNFSNSEISETGTCSCYRQMTSKTLPKSLVQIRQKKNLQSHLKKVGTCPLRKLQLWPSYGIKVYVSLHCCSSETKKYFLWTQWNCIHISDKRKKKIFSPYLPVLLTLLLVGVKGTVICDPLQALRLPSFLKTIYLKDLKGMEQFSVCC